MKKTVLIMALLVSPALMSMQRAKAAWKYTADTKIGHVVGFAWGYTGGVVLDKGDQAWKAFNADQIKLGSFSLKKVAGRTAVVASALWAACAARDAAKTYKAKARRNQFSAPAPSEKVEHEG